jgi:uncharacterized NAD(P)/FAD-binding protein YdhS
MGKRSGSDIAISSFGVIHTPYIESVERTILTRQRVACLRVTSISRQCFPLMISKVPQEPLRPEPGKTGSRNGVSR